MQNWLARLAFPFLVLAFVLAWEGYRASSGQTPGVGQGRVMLYFASAAVLFGLGLRGIRERHRPR
jgi:hypothetical protein